MTTTTAPVDAVAAVARAVTQDTRPATAIARDIVDQLIASQAVRPARGGGLVETCPRCDGRAYMAEYSFSFGGECFQCGATGWLATTDERLVNRYADRIRRARRDERERPAREAAQRATEAAAAEAAAAEAATVETWRAANRELVADLQAAAADGVRFAAELIERLDSGRVLTDGQRAAAVRLVEDRRAAQPAPSGRVAVSGVIVSAREHESNFGYHPSVTVKMTVRDDRGFTTWGTMPAAMDDGRELDAWRGQRVTFTATLTPSDSDPTFARFARPTRAQLVD